MGRTCTICNHKDHESINSALIGSESLRTIADRWSVSKTSLLRHKADHLPATLVEAVAAAAVAEGDNLMDRLRQLSRETTSILAEARTAGSKDNNLALKAIGRAERQLELMRRLLGEYQAGGSVNLEESPEWQELRTAILLALEPFPEARLAVAKAVKNVGA
jgi:hypothetical protein